MGSFHHFTHFREVICIITVYTCICIIIIIIIIIIIKNDVQLNMIKMF